MTHIKIIKSKEQHREYTDRLQKLWENPADANEDERELLELLIETWERENLRNDESDPVELIKFLMDNHQLDRNRMMEILGINKATLSKILNYRKGLSKEVIRKLSAHFKISQEAFNKPYPLLVETPKTETRKKKARA